MEKVKLKGGRPWLGRCDRNCFCVFPCLSEITSPSAVCLSSLYSLLLVARAGGWNSNALGNWEKSGRSSAPRVYVHCHWGCFRAHLPVNRHLFCLESSPCRVHRRNITKYTPAMFGKSVVMWFGSKEGRVCIGGWFGGVLYIADTSP